MKKERNVVHSLIANCTRTLSMKRFLFRIQPKNLPSLYTHNNILLYATNAMIFYYKYYNRWKERERDLCYIKRPYLLYILDCWIYMLHMVFMLQVCVVCVSLVFMLFCTLTISHHNMNRIFATR